MSSQPYIGLRPFDEDDHRLFFGREEQIVALLRKLEDHHFVAVVGSSGSGKSSLVRAGLIPALREGFMDGIRDWTILVVKPGNEPYLHLAESLQKQVRKPLAYTGTEGALAAVTLGSAVAALGSTAAELATFLRRSDRSLLDVLGQLGTKALVVVDQFEELFSFRRASVASETVAPRDMAAAFVNMLLCSCRDAGGNVWVVLTLRSDFSGDCEAFLGLPEAVSQSQFLVPRLTRWQMQDAIVGPSRLRDCGFAPFTVSDALVNRIINDAGDRPDQLPLMQHALLQTWKGATGSTSTAEVVLDLDHYLEAGGVERALSRHADEAWQAIAMDSRKAPIACRLFLLLCEVLQDGQIVRRRTSGAEVADCTGGTMEEITDVVKLFQEDGRNFVVTSPEGAVTRETLIDVSHEVLLRRWDLFSKQWLVQERADAAELRRLTEQAEIRDGGLLPEKDLARVEAWRGRVSENWARRYVSVEAWLRAIAYIEESREAVRQTREQQRRQKRQRAWLLRSFVLCMVVATVVSSWAAWVARREKKTAEDALTTSYLRDITARGGTALWNLAELDEDREIVRRNIIDNSFGSIERLRPALQQSSAGLLAATGLNPRMIGVLRSDAGRLIQNTLQGGSPTDLTDLESLVVNVGGALNQDDIRDVAVAVINDARLHAREPIILARRLSAIGQILGSLEDRNAAGSAAKEAAAMIVQAMDPAHSSDLVNLTLLTPALTNLGDFEAAQTTIRDAAAALAQQLSARIAKFDSSNQPTSAWGESMVVSALLSLLAADRDSAGREALAGRVSLALLISHQRSEVLMLQGQFRALLPLLSPPTAADVALRVGNDILSNDSEDFPAALYLAEIDHLFLQMRENDANVMATAVAERIAHVAAQRSIPPGFNTWVRMLALLLPQVNAEKRTQLATTAASVIEPMITRPLPKVRSALWHQNEAAFAAILREVDPSRHERLASVRAGVIAAELTRATKARDVAAAGDYATVLMNWERLLSDNERGSRAAAAMADLLSLRISAHDAQRVDPFGAFPIADLAKYIDADAAKNLALEVADVFPVGNGVASVDLSKAAAVEGVIAGRMHPDDANALAEQLLQRMSHATGRNLTSLADVLVGFVRAAPRQVDRERLGLAAIRAVTTAAAQPANATSNVLAGLGYQLGVFAESLPDAAHVRLLPLSLILAQTPSILQGDEAADVWRWVGQLAPAELIEVLKWPICREDCRARVLEDLALAGRPRAKTPWEFAQKALAEDRALLRRPARQPRVGELRLGGGGKI